MSPDDLCLVLLFFFFNDTATTEIYTLSLHDALPIRRRRHQLAASQLGNPQQGISRRPLCHDRAGRRDQTRNRGQSFRRGAARGVNNCQSSLRKRCESGDDIRKIHSSSFASFLNASISSSEALSSERPCAASARSISSASSRILCSTARGSFQSKPTCEALRCNSIARASAGWPVLTLDRKDLCAASAGGRPAARSACSSALMRSQAPLTSDGLSCLSLSANTCGCLLIILRVIASTTSPNENACCSSAMRA